MPLPKKIAIVTAYSEGELDSGTAYVDIPDAHAAADRMRSEVDASTTIIDVHVVELVAKIADGDNHDINTPVSVSKTKKKKAESEHTTASKTESDDELAKLGSDPTKKTPKPKRELTDKQRELKTARQTPPEGRPHSLKGLKMMFIGTLTLEHKAYNTTATSCGGEVAKKIEDADYVVVGEKPGDKKTEALTKSGTKQITEDAFFTMIGGVKPTLKHAADDCGDGETPAKKQKKK